VRLEFFFDFRAAGSRRATAAYSAATRSAPVGFAEARSSSR
jgi:hypothetical protein